MPKILAIETSCDETGIAILEGAAGALPRVLSQSVSSQVNIHALTGGVVPEIAAREHLGAITPMIRENMRQSGLEPANIDAIAVTVGPGLIPALTVGVMTARTLAFAWKKPVVPVHHLEGHIYSALLSADKPPEDFFPALALIVSGGHTLLIQISGHLTYKIIGSTLDDAAGEAFDKVARLLDLPYPGGPVLSKLATSGDPAAFAFPRPMLHADNLNFSFSGLKTAVLYTLRDFKGELTPKVKANIAASFQQAVVDVLAAKTVSAFNQYSAKALLLAGGVAANQALRSRLQQESVALGAKLLVAPLHLCGDNAVMIGQAGLYALAAKRTQNWQSLDAFARLSIEQYSLTPLH